VPNQKCHSSSYLILKMPCQNQFILKIINMSKTINLYVIFNIFVKYIYTLFFGKKVYQSSFHNSIIHLYFIMSITFQRQNSKISNQLKHWTVKLIITIIISSISGSVHWSTAELKKLRSIFCQFHQEVYVSVNENPLTTSIFRLCFQARS